MATTFPSTWCPTTATNAKLTPRVLRGQFGDGYIQLTADGINNMLLQWEVFWDPIPAYPDATGQANAQDLDNFFRGLQGYQKFIWVAPTPYDTLPQSFYICPEWNYIFADGRVRGIKALFQQVPV
jgi:phage-related protein